MGTSGWVENLLWVLVGKIAALTNLCELGFFCVPCCIMKIIDQIFTNCQPYMGLMLAVFLSPLALSFSSSTLRGMGKLMQGEKDLRRGKYMLEPAHCGCRIESLTSYKQTAWLI